MKDKILSILENIKYKKYTLEEIKNLLVTENEKLLLLEPEKLIEMYLHWKLYFVEFENDIHYGLEEVNYSQRREYYQNNIEYINSMISSKIEKLTWAYCNDFINSVNSKELIYSNKAMRCLILMLINDQFYMELLQPSSVSGYKNKVYLEKLKTSSEEEITQLVEHNQKQHQLLIEIVMKFAFETEDVCLLQKIFEYKRYSERQIINFLVKERNLQD